MGRRRLREHEQAVKERKFGKIREHDVMLLSMYFLLLRAGRRGAPEVGVTSVKRM